MRRLIAVVTAGAFAFATPAFAQGVAPVNAAAQTVSAPATSDQSLLLDGQDALAQGGLVGSPLLIGGLIIVGGVVVAVIIANNNRSHSP